MNKPTTQCYENEIDNKYTMKILGKKYMISVQCTREMRSPET